METCPFWLSVLLLLRDMYVTLTIVLMIIQQRVDGSHSIDVYEAWQERSLNTQKKRLSLQNTGDPDDTTSYRTVEIQKCLVSAGDVGCSTFECFNNNSCKIRELDQICMSFLQNAGRFDTQGKLFIKDALKCMAHGLRHKFSCISRRCVAVKEMVFQLQRECYIKHNVCLAAMENVSIMVEMIYFHDLFPKGPHVELVNVLLNCSEELRATIAHQFYAQCEKNWGILCASLNFCVPERSERKPTSTLEPVQTIRSAKFMSSVGRPPLSPNVEQV